MQWQCELLQFVSEIQGLQRGIAEAICKTSEAMHDTDNPSSSDFQRIRKDLADEMHGIIRYQDGTEREG